ncbi:glycosyltransferase family 39 protein [Butyrivibrio sp.]|uniref:glycosyltransferase family 39 protein n=1 Tax=Butyrivibrio sp. TaxID=28121 RepID=UPI0025B7EA48|nr:glycosyltransferase family 39 protein [Butyrivibrio sp.]MBQ9305305.1 glycosyltransferase family 39 protein [Butyrivibrio sp.]
MNLIIVFCLLVAAVLVLGTSIVTTIYYDYGCENDWPHYGKENILLLLLLCAGVVFGLMVLKKKRIFKSSKGPLLFGLAFCTVYCLMLIFAIRPLPVNDSKTLDDIINSFMGGDYSSLTNKEGYLYIWPFQLGYVAFGQLMSTIFGIGNYIAWDLIQLLSILITVYLLYQMTWEFFGDREVCSIMAVLSAGMLFFYNYVTYIYGDILSMAPQTIALFLEIMYMKRKRIGYGIGAGVAIAFAIMLKTNCEIALIALVMMHVMNLFSSDIENSGLVKVVLIVLIMFGLTFGVKKTVNSYYSNVTGLDSIPTGSPAVSHIAMGLQESELEDGWYNGYNYHVFAENGYDTEATKTAAIENIKATLSDFAHRPLHAGKFFLRKFLTQWADSVCISTHNLDLVNRHHDNPTWLAGFLVSGFGSTIMQWVMNVYMTICYLGVVLYLFSVLKNKKVSDSEMLILILIFGGIVFHEFWEGSSRYAMRYYVYWIPFAAFGIKKLLDYIGERFGSRG